MSKTPVITIFDVGKTNKKLFLFDEKYQIIFQETFPFPEIKDEDGFPCEDIASVAGWIRNSLDRLTARVELDIMAVNFSAYGASLVHVNENGQPLAPLYNYLKPFPPDIKLDFYNKYGGETDFSKCTASPVLGNLNAGLQLYRLKYQQPHLFKKIRYSLDLAQYLSGLLTRKTYSDITSIGCHTGLWNFAENNYHDWVYRENISAILARIFPSDGMIPSVWNGQSLVAGVGLHDSSAALIPYQMDQNEPFLLLSTGTWCISLNPFNPTPLTTVELEQDCLCYLEYRGRRIKASRLFAGYEHELQIKRLAEHFNCPTEHYKTIALDTAILSRIEPNPETVVEASKTAMIEGSLFRTRPLSTFDNYAVAYHQLLFDMISLQVHSTRLILDGTSIKRLFVDGGFIKNTIYMQMLAMAFPDMQVFVASVAESSALGAALAIHHHWNKQEIPSNLIKWQSYPSKPV